MGTQAVQAEAAVQPATEAAVQKAEAEAPEADGKAPTTAAQAEAQLEQKGEILAEMQTKHDHRAEDLKAKQSELDEIIAETRAEEEILSKMSGKMSGKIDDRLLQAYLRIRGGAKNGMAVVPIEREASAGSYIKIPPQRILDVGARKRIIVDEHSGRILVDQELAMEEQEKVQKLVAKELKAAAKA